MRDLASDPAADYIAREYRTCTSGDSAPNFHFRFLLREDLRCPSFWETRSSHFTGTGCLWTFHPNPSDCTVNKRIRTRPRGVPAGSREWVVPLVVRSTPGAIAIVIPCFSWPSDTLTTTCSCGSSVPPPNPPIGPPTRLATHVDCAP